MKIFVVGAKAQARMIHNIIEDAGHTAPYVFDQDPEVSPPWDCELVRNDADFDSAARKCEGFVVCIGDVERGELRVRFSRRLEALGLKPASAVHKTAHLGSKVKVGKGLQ